MQDRPTATEILGTIGEFLELDVLPLVEGALRYKTLVAANLLALLQRELSVGEAPEIRQRDELAALLDDRPLDAEPEGVALSALNARLQARLLSAQPLDRAFLQASRDTLERVVLDKLAVNKPGYDRYDQATEVG